MIASSAGAMKGVRTVTLSLPIKLAVPPLFIASLPKNAIGFSFEGGIAGALIGGALLAAGGAIGFVLFPIAGAAGVALSVWLLGSTGSVMLYNGVEGIAFVKPLCSTCRLLPVIEEHEAIHLTGVASDDEIWETVGKTYSCASLSLNGDPTICSFCPIPKRLQEH